MLSVALLLIHFLCVHFDFFFTLECELEKICVTMNVSWKKQGIRN